MIGLMFVAAVTATYNHLINHVIHEKKKKKKTKRRHRWWVRPWIKRREVQEQNNTLYKLRLEMQIEDQNEFRLMMRMDEEVYTFILNAITYKIQKKNTKFRKAIPPDQRLTIFLRYLAYGESQAALTHGYRIGRTTVHRIIKETAMAIFDVLSPEFLHTPQTEEEWIVIADGYYDRWQFPNCIGALDGKHVRISVPAHSGTDYHNYKGFSSLVLMALVDHDYNFLYVDVGAHGRCSDAGVWRDCTFSKRLHAGTLQIPPPRCLPKNPDVKTPFVIVADDAFPLGTHIQKPYSLSGISYEERIFNYRLSRARRMSENAFGILANRFRVFLGRINMLPDSATYVVLAAVVLHNVLRAKNPRRYIPANAVDQENADGTIRRGDWREVWERMEGLGHGGQRNPTVEAKNVRVALTRYFGSVGAVRWQDRALQLARKRSREN